MLDILHSFRVKMTWRTQVLTTHYLWPSRNAKRSDHPVRDTPEQPKKCGILWFHCTNQTSQDYAQHKRSVKNLKTDASLLWNTVLCLCLRKNLYPAWASSICRNQFQLGFPKTFYWNSKKTWGESRSSCRIVELTTLPNACCAFRKWC